MSREIEKLRRQIEHERSEEQRNVEQMRVWIAAQEEASRGFLNAIFNRSESRYASEQMQRFADIANRHQARANELTARLRDLERDAG